MSKSVMWSAEFRKGYEDCKLGNPWFDDYVSSRDAWSYARGRQFAALYPNIALKHGKKVNYRTSTFCKEGMMLTLEALEAAGYKKFKSTLSQYALFGMEKRIEDQFGTKYFIHVEVFGPYPHQCPTTYNFDTTVQFIDNDHFEVGKKPTINMTYIDDEHTTIEAIEYFFERAWEFLGCPYYERNES